MIDKNCKKCIRVQGELSLCEDCRHTALQEIYNKRTETIRMSGFKEELSNLLNRYSMENGSNTPDSVLATYLMDCLTAYNMAVLARDKWYGINLYPGHGVAFGPGPVNVTTITTSGGKKE